MEEKTGVRLEDSKLEELPVEEINNVVLQQQRNKYSNKFNSLQAILILVL